MSYMLEIRKNSSINVCNKKKLHFGYIFFENWLALKGRK